MQTPTHASQVFAFLRRNYRVSRNTRALWQFQQIDASPAKSVRIPTSDEINQSSDEILLLSAVDQKGTPIAPSSTIICTNTTRFSYFTTRYKFAFILDMTDSCASVSIDGGHIYLESLTNCLCILLYSLAQTLSLPGCELKFQPEIDVSVYVYFPLHRTPSHQVLIHGYRLTWSTLESVCRDIVNSLKIATNLLHNIITIEHSVTSHSASSTMNSEDNINSHLNSMYSNSESSCAIINMLSYGITALQLMPEESTAGLVIITDGILDVPNLAAFEAVMRQIRARIISCSFVQIGATNSQPPSTDRSQQPKKNQIYQSPIASLGHVPNEELLRFISSSTFGSFIHFDIGHISAESTSLARLFSSGCKRINGCKRLIEFQTELLSWGFHKAVGEHPTSLLKGKSNEFSTVHTEKRNNNKLNAASLPVSCKLVNQTVLRTSLENVLSLRLREGYAVKDVQIQKDEIEVHLVLPWRYDIQICYTARSVWPLEQSVRTEIRVYKEAPIYFLQDLNQLSHHHNSKSVNTIQHNVIRRYNDVIQTVSVTDRHLTLINTFAQDSSYYRVPDTVKRGKAIFYVSQNNLQQIVLNFQDQGLQKFADFWRPIVVLDGSLWQRFMYTHNLTLILINDSLTDSLFLMNNHLTQSHNPQHSVVSCRKAKSDFEAFLAEYFSFVLLDGQSYIKFLIRENNDTVPYSFMLLRIMGQPPLLYLKLAFQSNATTVERHKIIDDFRTNLMRLRPRSRMKSGNPNENNRKQQTSTPVSSNSHRSSTVSVLSTQSRWSVTSTPCCVILNKNIERLMLKPDPFPYESLGIPRTEEDDFQHKNRTEVDSKRQALSKFFYIRTFVRSFESVRHSSNIPKRVAEIILDTFIRRRLQEGFQFAISHNNTHNLVLEVKMNTPKEDSANDVYQLNTDSHMYPDEKIRTCLIQYRIYPVEYSRSTDTSPAREVRSMPLRRSSSIFCDQPTCYYFLTQCWIEPQDGVVDSNNSESEFLNRCTYKEIVHKIGEVDEECFNTIVSFYFVKHLQERSLSLTRPVSRAPRAITSDVVRMPFVQDTINLIRQSHQTYFDFLAFIDDYDKIKDDYIHKGLLTLPSLNSTLLIVLREYLISKKYRSKPQLFVDVNENNTAFTRTLLARKSSHLPLGLRTLKSNAYLVNLLNYDERRSSTRQLSDLERYLIEMLFPRWDFLVYTDSDDANRDDCVYMILLPRTERDLLLLNTDLTLLMHDLIAHYSKNHLDNGKPVYDDCRKCLGDLLDTIETSVGWNPPCFFPSDSQTIEEQIGKSPLRRRQRRDTFTATDLLTPHPHHNGRGTSTSSPITITHSFSQRTHHSFSQPAPTGYRRVHSPLTMESNNLSIIEPSPRRYSASAAVSPPTHHQHHMRAPPILNLVPPSPQQIFSQETFKNLTNHQWHIPVLLYGCNRTRLVNSLLRSNEQQSRDFDTETYIDCTLEEIGTATPMTTVAAALQNIKPRKRDNSRRHDESNEIPHKKQMDDIRESLDYAFATAFYKNCLLDLITHRTDVEHVLNNIYQEHCEDIDLTAFLKAMCSHLSPDCQTSFLSALPCEPTTKRISTYLHEKFLEIISKFFQRVSPDLDYFYFCTDEERFQQSRNSSETEDRISNNEPAAASGPYKFDETTGRDAESDTDEIDRESIGTVLVNDDDEDPELQASINRRRSDVSSSSLSNHSRDLCARGEVLPLFICFDCRLLTKDYDHNTQVKTIPLCINTVVSDWDKAKLDYDSLRVSFSLMCLTFERDDIDVQNIGVGLVTGSTPTFNQPVYSLKRLQELNSINALENASTCTGTTTGGDLNKNPLDKLRLSEVQRQAILACRQEIEWLLRDEQLSTYFTRRSLDRKLIENVIEHVQSSVNIQKSNCLCRSIDLMFVLGIDKSLELFLKEVDNIRIREKYLLAKCQNYSVLLEPLDQDSRDTPERRVSALSTNSSDEQTSVLIEESLTSDSSLIDDEEDAKLSEDELDDFVKPSFWLFIERQTKPSDQLDILEMKFYLYCGSSSDAEQNSSEPQAILDELIRELNGLCRTINQKLLLANLSSSRLCNPLLVPPGENDDTTLDADTQVLSANLSVAPGTFACDELWTHSFPLHFRLRPHLHASSSSKSSSSYHPGSLLRELGTQFGSFAVLNRKNLFVYSVEGNDYYLRFTEDIHLPSTPGFINEPLVLSESNGVFAEPPSPHTSHPNSSILKNRHRHDSGTSCIYVTVYGLKTSAAYPISETVKNNLVNWVVSRLEDEVVKELVNALYHFAMTRLNPDDVTFIRPIDKEPKHVFEYQISPLINTNVFLYYLRRYVKTNQFHQPLLLPILAKDLKEIVKDYHGQTLMVYNHNYNIRVPRPGLAWIELHVLHPNNRPSPLSTEDLSDELTIESLLDLIRIIDRQTSSTNSISDADSKDSTENILRCNVWARGSQTEIDPTVMSKKLLQAFSYALADYITEYVLLQTLYNTQRHGSFEPPPSPRALNPIKSSDEPNFLLDRNLPTTRTFTMDTMPSTPSIQSRRRQESIQGSMLSTSSTDEPQSLSVEYAECLTTWFHYLSEHHPKLPSFTSKSHKLVNRIFLMDIIHSFTSWLNDQKFIAYKHESLRGTVFRCNEERTSYLPVSSLDEMPTRVPGQNRDLIVLYQSTKMANDMISESAEPSPQQDSGDAMALANSADIPKQIFLCIVANDKNLTMILHNAPDELSDLLMKNFSNIICWSNDRLQILNIIVTQKMGLFPYRSFHYDHHTACTCQQSQPGPVSKHSAKGDAIGLEQLIKESLPPKTGNPHPSGNIDLFYCNLTGLYPPISNDSSDDLVEKQGTQLLQLRDNKKNHMDRCTNLEEICSNWMLKPILTITDELLTQMKYRSRLLTIGVVPILFSRPSRHFFQNNLTLRANSTLSLDACAATEGSLANRMTNKRKSVAIPVDLTFHRCLRSADESDFQIAQSQLTRFDTNRATNLDQHHVQIIELFLEQIVSHLQTNYKFHPIKFHSSSSKLPSRKIIRSAHNQSTPVEHNFHRSDPNRRATLLAELSTLNNVQIVLRFLQYDIIKTPTNNQSSTNNHFRQSASDSFSIPDQPDLDAFMYDFHLQTIIRHLTNSSNTPIFSAEFSLIAFLQDFIEYYPSAPIGSKTALLKAVIQHPVDPAKRSADTHLFKYVLEHASAYDIRITRRNADEYLFDCDENDIYWMAARTSSSTPSELTIVLYIIYTNLSPKQAELSNKIPVPTISNIRMGNSWKSNTTNIQMRERASTMLLPPTKVNLVVPVRPNPAGSEATLANNIPAERNLEYFKGKLTSILEKASLSYRRENLWERLIASRIDNSNTGRQETGLILTKEFKDMLGSCLDDEKLTLPASTVLLQRVLNSKEQTDRLHRFLRLRYGSQFHQIGEFGTNFYLVIFQSRAPQPCEALIVLECRTEANSSITYLVKHRNDIDCAAFTQTFTQRISYFLWECLI